MIAGSDVVCGVVRKESSERFQQAQPLSWGLTLVPEATLKPVAPAFAVGALTLTLC